MEIPKPMVLCLPALAILAACNTSPDLPQGEWITGQDNEKLQTIELHFRGLDVAMIETDYRYQELYWAGQDENWDHAAYQLDKLKLALENGLQRRPKRAQSAEHFLAQTLPQMQQAVTTQDTAVFNRSFRVLTADCNSCHAMEKVPFFTVKTPAFRQSSIRR